MENAIGTSAAQDCSTHFKTRNFQVPWVKTQQVQYHAAEYIHLEAQTKKYSCGLVSEKNMKI